MGNPAHKQDDAVSSERRVAQKLAQSITYAEARSRSPKIPRLSEHVDRALKDEGVWQACQPYLYGTSKTGSTQFNHANVVRELREWDAEHNGNVINSSGLNDVAIWHVAQRQLRNAFMVQRGIVVGLLEFSEQPGESAEHEGGDAE